MLGIETIVEIVGLVEKVDTALIEEIPCVTKIYGGESTDFSVNELLSLLSVKY